jgi:hypothetical protein
MFNLMSFLIGVAVVFVGGSIVTLISNLLNYDDREAAFLYCNCWWMIFATIFIGIKQIFFPFLIITEQEMQRLKKMNRLEGMKHLFKNVYLVPQYKKEFHPVLGRILWAVVIVKK